MKFIDVDVKYILLFIACKIFYVVNIMTLLLFVRYLYLINVKNLIV